VNFYQNLGRAFKNDPVNHFSEGARLQGGYNKLPGGQF
jgi:hypothetical protein